MSFTKYEGPVPLGRVERVFDKAYLVRDTHGTAFLSKKAVPKADAKQLKPGAYILCRALVLTLEERVKKEKETGMRSMRFSRQLEYLGLAAPVDVEAYQSNKFYQNAALQIS